MRSTDADPATPHRTTTLGNGDRGPIGMAVPASLDGGSLRTYRVKATGSGRSRAAQEALGSRAGDKMGK